MNGNGYPLIASPELNARERACWYGDRLRELGVEFDPAAPDHKLAATYRQALEALARNAGRGSGRGRKEQRRGTATAAAEVKRARIEWLMPGRVPLGLVTVLAGVGGLGKSQWTCLLAGQLSRGDLGVPGSTLLLTAEDSASATVRPRLEAVGANLVLVHFVSVATQDGDDGLIIPDDLAELDRLVVEQNARLVIVDPLVAHLPSGIDSHKDQSVRAALAPLYRLAEARGCAVVALLHLNKAQGLEPLMRLSGSGAFGNAARSVLLLDRDPDDPAGEVGDQRVLAHLKCNVAPLASSLLYRVVPIVLPATAGEPEIETSRLELLGESQHNGRSLLATTNDEERSAIDEAAEFLTAELADGGRRLAADLLRDARKIGISEPTLRRARKRLGVQTEKAGFGRGWEWWLEVFPAKASSPLTAPQNDEARRLGANLVTMRDSGLSDSAENAEGVSPGTLTPSADLTPSQDRFPTPESDEIEWLRNAPLDEIRALYEGAEEAADGA